MEEQDYLKNTSHERTYLDLSANAGYSNETEKLEQNDSKISLHIKLKNAATKKFRPRIWGYALGEHLYILGQDGLTLHKTYLISQEDDDFWNEKTIN